MSKCHQVDKRRTNNCFHARKPSNRFLGRSKKCFGFLQTGWIHLPIGNDYFFRHAGIIPQNPKPRHENTKSADDIAFVNLCNEEDINVWYGKPSCKATAFNLIKSFSEILIDMVLFFDDVALAIFEYCSIFLVLDPVETNLPLSADLKIFASSFVSFMFFFILDFTSDSKYTLISIIYSYFQPEMASLGFAMTRYLKFKISKMLRLRAW